MSTTDAPLWETKAAAKRASILAQIPSEWRLTEEQLQDARKQRDLTGTFIQALLPPEHIPIICKDSVELAKDIKAGKLTAVQVTTAFCRAAGVAHQIVVTPLLPTNMNV